MKLRNRQDAGVQLAEKLSHFRGTDTLVLALPRGGVPVAYEISSRLDLSLNILAVRKIGAPFQHELALGAICEDGKPWWNERLLFRLNLTPEELNQEVRTAREQIQNQIATFRFGRRLNLPRGAKVIVVDDGLATGATMFAAVGYLRGKGVDHLVAALPVSAANTSRQLESLVDELVVIEDTDDFSSVSEWYLEFAQVSNEEVLNLLPKPEGQMYT